ncbi:MAG: hypothetical protein ABSD99_04470, partial [Candidatus Bathyarchaeia archaeon]
IGPGELAKELEFLPSTVQVHFKIPRKGLLIDSFHFPLRWGGQRAIVMRTDSLTSIFSRITGVFGDGAAARVVMYEMGEAAGRAIMKDLLIQLGSIVRDELDSTVGLYSSNGWGLFEVVSVDLDRKNAEFLPLNSRSHCRLVLGIGREPGRGGRGVLSGEIGSILLFCSSGPNPVSNVWFILR